MSTEKPADETASILDSHIAEGAAMLAYLRERSSPGCTAPTYRDWAEEHGCPLPEQFEDPKNFYIEMMVYEARTSGAADFQRMVAAFLARHHQPALARAVLTLPTAPKLIGGKLAHYAGDEAADELMGKLHGLLAVESK